MYKFEIEIPEKLKMQEIVMLQTGIIYAIKNAVFDIQYVYKQTNFQALSLVHV
jgi:hypothetical protein